MIQLQNDSQRIAKNLRFRQTCLKKLLIVRISIPSTTDLFADRNHILLYFQLLNTRIILKLLIEADSPYFQKATRVCHHILLLGKIISETS